MTQENKLRSASGHIQIDANDFETFREHQLRLYRRFWLVAICAAVGCGFAIGELWSFAIGFLVAAAIGLIGHETIKRWNRACWIRRFPELRQGGFEWKQTSGGWGI
ncbi:MAG TPA: hypothetical protein VFI54_05040 [Solirubrobacteraceae bacterium]|nr:hypothetical protein [Solirubrobacteraceae bacterium]